MVDQLSTEQNIIVVPGAKMECDVLLGHDFIKKYRMIADKRGYTFLNREPDSLATDEYNVVYFVVKNRLLLCRKSIGCIEQFLFFFATSLLGDIIHPLASLNYSALSKFCHVWRFLAVSPIGRLP